MQKYGVDARCEDILDILLLDDRLTVEYHIVALDGYNLAGILVHEVLGPGLEHTRGELAAHCLLEVRTVDADLLGQTEDLDDVLVTLEAYRTQKGRHREFLLTVDVGIHDIIDVSGKLDPAAAEGDDTGAVELGAVGMRALSEEHTRRTVELRHDNALRTIDHKRTLVRHVRDRAQIHILDHSVEILVVRVGAIELELSLEGDTVGQTTLQTLVDGIARRVDVVVEKLEDKVVAGVGDGEILGKHLEKALVLTLLRRCVKLKEVLERLQLHLEKVRIREGILDRREIDAGLRD